MLVAAILAFGFAASSSVSFDATVSFLVAAAAFAFAGLATIAYGLRLRAPGEGGFPLWSDLSPRRKGVVLTVLGPLPLVLGGLFLWWSCTPVVGLVSCPTEGCNLTYPLCNPIGSLVGIALGAFGADMMGLGFLLLWWSRDRTARSEFSKVRMAKSR